MNLESLFFSQKDIEFIHEQSVALLSKAGCIFDDDRTIDIFKKHGAKVDGHTVYFNHDMIDKALETVVNEFTLTKPNGESYTMGNGSKTMATAGSPPYILDEGKFRFALMSDYLKICKLVETSDCIDMTHLLLCDTYDVPREDRSYVMTAALLKYTTLPISLTALNTNEHHSGEVATNVVKMIQDFTGFYDKHVAIGCISPISPLAWVKDSLDAMYAYCDLNQPMQLATCSLPVLTSPASLLSTIIQNNAELLAIIVLLQMVKPGIPVFYGNTSTSTNLRTVSMALGNSETALISLATAAMSKYYKMPFRASGALNDAIDIDYQAGVESAINLMSGTLSDTDLLFFSCGMLSGFNVTSLEKYVADEQLIKMVKRLYRGIAIDYEKDYIKEIVKVGPRGNFMKGRTPKEYREEHYIPDLFVKEDYNSWQTEDKKSVKEKCTQKVTERLENYKMPDHTEDQLKVIAAYDSWL